MGVATLQPCLHSYLLPEVPKHILIHPTGLSVDSGSLLWATDNLPLSQRLSNENQSLLWSSEDERRAAGLRHSSSSPALATSTLP